MMEFQAFNKIPRISRNMVVTEKLDGTNGQIAISDTGIIYAGSRNRWLSLESDNFGFCKWVLDNKEELLKLGPGRHYGEWWGVGIQRGYGLSERRFSLFNVSKWSDDAVRPMCCHVVPTLVTGLLDTTSINVSLDLLKTNGSVAAEGFMDPEGICIYHEAAGTYFKKTLKDDEAPKGQIEWMKKSTTLSTTPATHQVLSA
jgi:RNA ligase